MSAANNIYQKMKMKATDVAGQMAGSGWTKAVFPKNLSGELDDTLVHNAKAMAARNALGDRFGKDLEMEGISGVQKLKATEAIRKADAGNIEDAYDSLENIFKKNANPRKKERFMQNFSGMADEMDISSVKEDIMNEPGAFGIKNPFRYHTKRAAAYFQNPDDSIRRTRYATAGAAYAGMAVGGRFLSGGTLTHDEYGKSDLAGIPFI